MDAFKFPDELEEKKIDIEIEGDVDLEVEIEDDTPERDRGRKPLDREVADPTDDEIESYSDKVKTASRNLPTPVTTSAGTRKPFCGKSRSLSVLHNSCWPRTKASKAMYTKGRKRSLPVRSNGLKPSLT